MGYVDSAAPRLVSRNDVIVEWFACCQEHRQECLCHIESQARSYVAQTLLSVLLSSRQA